MVQGGPTLIVNSPVEGQAYNGSLTIEILVDPGASAPTATLAGMPRDGAGARPADPASSTSMYDVYRATVCVRPAADRPRAR